MIHPPQHANVSRPRRVVPWPDATGIVPATDLCANNDGLKGKVSFVFGMRGNALPQGDALRRADNVGTSGVFEK